MINVAKNCITTAKAIIFHPKNAGSQQINIDSLNLIIPKQAMYIALASFQKDDYSYWVPVKMANADMDTIKINGGSSSELYTRDSRFSFYNFKTGPWIFGDGCTSDKTRAHVAIRYQIKYAVCNDKY